VLPQLTLLGIFNRAFTISVNREESPVAELNKRFGKRWVDWGIDALMSHLQKVLPAQVVALVGVVSAVELASRRTPMTSYAKQQAAVQMALVS
jgi:hypothetical protein